MDTTVILAQPRVPRLRADVVYVASVGLESGLNRRTLDPGFLSLRISRAPPKIAVTVRGI